MPKIIVADTGPLIALALVDLLGVLPGLFSEVYVPPSVLLEATGDAGRPGAQAITNALKNGGLTLHPVELSDKFQSLVRSLDKGEAEALALAKQLGAVVLIDERRERRVAELHHIPVTGSAAILILAKEAGLIDEVKPLIEKLSESGYRLSRALISEVLQRVGED